VTRSILGPAPIVDFDGTLTWLPVPWGDLRARLHVERIEQLWDSENTQAWAMVREAEVEAARRATPLEPMRALLEQSSAFAVLTSNAEEAVACFLQRFAALEARATTLVGRETLAGPKHERETFRRGFAQCVRATESARTDGRLVYAGDADWELDLARQLGAEAVDVRLLNTAS